MPARRIVGRFLCDLNVVRMALNEAGVRDADELGFLLKGHKIFCSAVAHAGLEAADELVDHILQDTAVRDAAFHAFRHEFLRIRLEVAVLAARVHGAFGAHAAISLVASALVHDNFARAFLCACEERAQHDGVRAGRDGFDNVTGVLDATIGNNRDIVAAGHLCAVHDGGELRHAYACDDAGGADGARAYADLDGVSACVDQVKCGFCRRDVAGNDLRLRERSAELGYGVNDVFAVAVCGVQSQDVDARLQHGCRTVHHVAAQAYGRAAKESCLVVRSAVREDDDLLDVLDGDEALQVALFVRQRQLFDLPLAQDLLRFHHGDAFSCGDEVFLGHDLVDRLGIVGFKAYVPVGDDPDELVGFVDYRHTRNPVALHEHEGVADVVLLREVKRIDNDAVLAALDLVDLQGLLLNGHVLVDDANAAFPGYGNGHVGFRDSIHAGAHDGDVERDLVGESCLDGDVAWEYL